MDGVTRSKIVKIGNSYGIRIPRFLLEQLGLRGEVELTVHEHQLLVRAAHRPRAGWEAQFQQMAERGDDQLLDPEAGRLTTWDAEEWQW